MSFRPTSRTAPSSFKISSSIFVMNFPPTGLDDVPFELSSLQLADDNHWGFENLPFGSFDHARPWVDDTGHDLTFGSLIFGPLISAEEAVAAIEATEATEAAAATEATKVNGNDTGNDEAQWLRPLLPVDAPSGVDDPDHSLTFDPLISVEAVEAIEAIEAIDNDNPTGHGSLLSVGVDESAEEEVNESKESAEEESAEEEESVQEESVQEVFVRPKRKFEPSGENYEERLVLRDALNIFKKLRKGSLGLHFAKSVQTFVNSFDRMYTTPLSLCLPPLEGSVAAIRDKLTVRAVKVVDSRFGSIVVEEMKSLCPGKKQKRSRFCFKNGEWVCGSQVLSF